MHPLSIILGYHAPHVHYLRMSCTPAHYPRIVMHLLPTLLKIGCYITPLGHYTILVIKTLQRELLITSMV